MALFVVFVFGLIIGSFLNALVFRLYKGETMRGRSHCPHCNHILKTVDLIPVVSFILLAGRCRYCHKRISWQYPIVEFTTGVLFVLAAVHNLQLAITNYKLLASIFFNFFFLSILIVTFVSDLRWNLIFDKLMIAGMGVALVFPLLTPNIQLLATYIHLLIAGAVGAGVFALQYIISKGKAVGSGDIYLGAFLGLILGLPAIIYSLGLAYIVGALVALLLIGLQKKTWKETLPLGAFLSLSGAVFLLFR